MQRADIYTTCTRTHTNRTGGKTYFSEKDKSHVTSLMCGNKNKSENRNNKETLNSSTEHRRVVPEAGAAGGQNVWGEGSESTDFRLGKK